MSTTSTYSLTENGKDLLVQGEPVTLTGDIHHWNTPNYTAELVRHIRKIPGGKTIVVFTLSIQYYVAVTVHQTSRKGRVKTGHQSWKQKNFSTPVTPEMAMNLKNGDWSPHNITKHFHTRNGKWYKIN